MPDSPFWTLTPPETEALMLSLPPTSPATMPWRRTACRFHCSVVLWTVLKYDCRNSDEWRLKNKQEDRQRGLLVCSDENDFPRDAWGSGATTGSFWNDR
jgi:hypothetical protein